MNGDGNSVRVGAWRVGIAFLRVGMVACDCENAGGGIVVEGAAANLSCCSVAPVDVSGVMAQCLCSCGICEGRNRNGSYATAFSTCDAETSQYPKSLDHSRLHYQLQLGLDCQLRES